MKMGFISIVLTRAPIEKKTTAVYELIFPSSAGEKSVASDACYKPVEKCNTESRKKSKCNTLKGGFLLMSCQLSV